ncbi:MAG: DNA translocase FtsK 4TM domain-containing protein, partial [bacterium]
MSYRLHTLNSDDAADTAPTRSGRGRFSGEALLFISFVLLAYWLLVLLSHDLADAAWSTSGDGSAVRNRGGQLGARLADASYYLLGFSVWWCYAAAVRVWLSALARWLRGPDLPDLATAAGASAGWLSRFVASRWGFWTGLALLLLASTAIEWSRFHRLEAYLPGHAGGVLGYWIGPLAVQWLGATGSALLAIGLWVLAVALVFRFSWGQVAERIGAWVQDFIDARRARREMAQDLALGQRAARERQEGVLEEREEIVEQHAPPVLIEPVIVEVPQSTRVAKERQKPLFADLPDSRLPQVDLLDGAQGRQETVSPETLEMTSRLIEKRLKDFGVEVRVVLAQPGPVITRYEIEPATGVKGSQIVGLAKDLARSLSLVSIRVVETIPGKNYMALELPNARRQSIKLSEILGSQVYNEAKSLLTMGLGKDIVG